MQNNSNAVVSLICGIVGIVVSIVGGLTFGVIGAGVGLALSVVSVVMGISAKKVSNGVEGTSGLTCGIIGVVFSAIFMVGCTICGSGSLGYGCYGCVGASMCVADDAQEAAEELEDALRGYYY